MRDLCTRGWNWSPSVPRMPHRKQKASATAKGFCDSIESRRSLIAERATHGSPVHLGGSRYFRNVAGATHCGINGAANAPKFVTCEHRV